MKIQLFFRTAVFAILICGFSAAASAEPAEKNYLRDPGFLNQNGEWFLTGTTSGIKELPPENGYRFQVKPGFAKGILHPRWRKHGPLKTPESRKTRHPHHVRGRFPSPPRIA